MDERELNSRKVGLEIYLKTLLNEKIYFIQSLFKFIEFDSTKYNEFSNPIDETTDIIGFKAISMGASEIIEPKE